MNSRSAPVGGEDLQTGEVVAAGPQAAAGQCPTYVQSRAFPIRQRWLSVRMKRAPSVTA